MARLTMWTYPHYEVRVEDLSIYTPFFREQLPLHRPIFFMRAMKGPIGIPVWCPNYNYAVRVFGKGTFDKYTPYYSREAVYLQNCFARQGAFIVRLADDTAQYASLVVECHVTEYNVPQWQRDSEGNYVLDANGDRVPVEGPGGPGTQQTMTGYRLRWVTRPLAVNETITGLTKTTVINIDNSTTTVYPIFAFRTNSPGSYGNELGFKLYFDKEKTELDMMNNIGSLTYMFSPVAKTYGQNTVSPIKTVFGDRETYLCFKDKAIDKRLNKDIAFKSVIKTQYFDRMENVSLIDFFSHVYSNYVEEIGTLIAGTEQASSSAFYTSNPFMYNILTGTYSNGVPLYTAVIDNTSTVDFNKNYIIYFTGGNDGDITDTAIEALTRQYLSDLVYVDILDSARYPFTHIYDTGVSLETKKVFIEFLSVRDDFKVILSTQDANRSRMNTKDEDYSIGASLHAACLLQPESIVFGTEVCRAEIYQQAGYLNDTTLYDGFLPATLDNLIKRCRWQSRDFIEGMPKGLPHSSVDIFKEWNWTPVLPSHKQMTWDIGLNYFQYYDMSRVHYPDFRSVYRYDTSVLSSSVFTDVIVYTKHIVRFNWARMSGLEMPFARLAEKAKINVLSDMTRMLNSLYGVEVRFYRTEEETKIGYITHGEIKLTGYPSNRIWIVDVKCYREGYTPEV